MIDGLEQLLRRIVAEALDARMVELSNRVVHNTSLVETVKLESTNQFAHLSSQLEQLTRVGEEQSGRVANQFVHVASQLQQMTRVTEDQTGRVANQFAHLASQLEQMTRVTEDQTGRVANQFGHMEGMFDSQRQEFRNSVVDAGSRVAHLANLMETRVKEVDAQVATLALVLQSVRLEAENRATELRDRLSSIELRLPPDPTLAPVLDMLQRVWPPHKAHDTADSSTPHFMALADSLARAVEAEVGMPEPVASTTASLQSGLDMSNGPIAVVCSTLDPGGAERQAALTAYGFARRKLDTVFVGHSQHRDLETHYYAPIIEERVGLVNAARLDPATVILGRSGADEASRLLATRLRALPLGTGEVLDRYLAAFLHVRPRVVHAWLDYTNILAGLAALWAGVPRVVLGLRNLNPSAHPGYQPFFRPIYELLLSDPRVRIISNTRAGARSYSQWLGISHERCAVVPNAFEPELLGKVLATGTGTTMVKPPARDETSPLVLGVFRLYHEKDPLLFVRAAAAIARALPSARFAIAGAGRLEREVKAEASRLGLGDRLLLPGRVTNVLEWMQSADILMHTAYIEGLPNVFLEAQGAGLPIVSTDAGGGTAEAIEQGVTGSIVPDRDPERIAGEVVRLLRLPDWLARARARGPEHVRSRFGLDRMIDETLAVYRS